jgi:hypothetical protein
MLAGFGVREETQEIFEVAQLEVAQHQSLCLDPRSGRKSVGLVVKRKQLGRARLLFAEAEAAETLVEAGYLAARIEPLATSAGPRRV